MPESWTVAAIDSITRTVGSTAAEGATSITLSPIGLGALTAGNKYIVETRDGEPNFVIKLSRIVSSTVVETQDPLPQDIPASSTIRGFKASYELETAQVKGVGQAIARWRVEDRDRVRYDWDDPFLIVNVATNYNLTSEALERIYPQVQRLRPDDLSLNELIDVAWKNYVRPDLEGKGLKANQIKSWERLDAPHAAACVYHLILTDERMASDFRDDWRTVYAHQMDLLFASVRFWYSETDDNTPGRSDENFSGRSISR